MHFGEVKVNRHFGGTYSPNLEGRRRVVVLKNSKQETIIGQNALQICTLSTFMHVFDTYVLMTVPCNTKHVVEIIKRTSNPTYSKQIKLASTGYHKYRRTLTH